MLMEEVTSPVTDTAKALVLVVDDEYGPRESVADVIPPIRAT